MGYNYLKTFNKMQEIENSKIEKNITQSESLKVPPSEGFREAFTLHLADTNLILAQRNAEWCGHGPILEQDIAITNISLDLLGQSRNFYQYAAQLINKRIKSAESEAPPLELPEREGTKFEGEASPMICTAASTSTRLL